MSDKGYRVSSRHLVNIGRASISILIIIVGVGIIIVLECLKRRRGRLHKATKASLPSGNTTDTSVHLAQLITESVKVSIHALKLCHDRIKSHTSHRRRGAEVDGAEGVGGAAISDHLECSCASLRIMVAASMAHMIWKWSEMGKGIENWCR